MQAAVCGQGAALHLALAFGFGFGFGFGLGLGLGLGCTWLWRVGSAVWLGEPIWVREIGLGRKRATSPPPWRDASGEPGGEPRGAWCEARKSSRLVRDRV